jgi:hypothetical protein
MNQDWVNATVRRSYATTVLITGVPTRTQDGVEVPVWSTVDDVLVRPSYHADGLLSILGILHQFPSALNTANFALFDRRVDGWPFRDLKVEFRAQITDWYDGKPGRENPFAWIHLGHGTNEADFIEIEDDGLSIHVEYEVVPGVTNGHEEGQLLSTRRLEKLITEAEGDIMFLGLPLCYATQVADELVHCGRIRMIHAQHEGFVAESLEFFPPKPPGMHRFSLDCWREWLWAIEEQWLASPSDDEGTQGQGC